MNYVWFAIAATLEIGGCFLFWLWLGVYVIASLLWLFLSERVRPTAFDLLGSGLCLAGTIVIVLGGKAAA